MLTLLQNIECYLFTLYFNINVLLPLFLSIWVCKTIIKFEKMLLNWFYLSCLFWWIFSTFKFWKDSNKVKLRRSVDFLLKSWVTESSSSLWISENTFCVFVHWTACLWVRSTTACKLFHPSSAVVGCSGVPTCTFKQEVVFNATGTLVCITTCCFFS